MLVLGGLAHVPNLFARHTFIFHFFGREHRLKDGECSQWFMRLAGCIDTSHNKVHNTLEQSDMHHRDSIRVTRAGCLPPWPLSYQNQVKIGV